MQGQQPQQPNVGAGGQQQQPLAPIIPHPFAGADQAFAALLQNQQQMQQQLDAIQGQVGAIQGQVGAIQGQVGAIHAQLAAIAAAVQNAPGVAAAAQLLADITADRGANHHRNRDQVLRAPPNAHGDRPGVDMWPHGLTRSSLRVLPGPRLNDIIGFYNLQHAHLLADRLNIIADYIGTPHFD